MMNKTVIALSALISVSVSDAANTFVLSGDNDYALYTGDATGTALTLLHENNLGWHQQSATNFTLPATGYLYAIVMNFGGNGGFSGGMNGTNIINAPWEYVDINTTALTAFPTVNDETYDVPETDLETALNGLTWNNASSIIRPANTAGVGVIDENGVTNTSATHYIVPNGFSARVFRIDVNDVPQVPEPSVAILVALGGLALSFQRRK